MKMVQLRLHCKQYVKGINILKGESKSPEIGKTEREIYLPREELFLLHSDICLAEAYGLG